MTLGPWQKRKKPNLKQRKKLMILISEELLGVLDSHAYVLGITKQAFYSMAFIKFLNDLLPLLQSVKADTELSRALLDAWWEESKVGRQRAAGVYTLKRKTLG